MDIQLPHNAFTVCFDSSDADAQARGNFFVAQTIRNKSQNSRSRSVKSLLSLGAEPWIN